MHHVWPAQIAAKRSDDALDRLVRAEAVARQRLDGDFGLESFAAAAGLGRSRFCQLYRALRGEAPGAFLQRERHARATALLRTTSLSLTQIASLVGYRDATVFIRAFRRTHGMTGLDVLPIICAVRSLGEGVSPQISHNLHSNIFFLIF